MTQMYPLSAGRRGEPSTSMENMEVNEENNSGHGNQSQDAAAATNAHGMGARPCQNGPRTRRKGRSFGASVIAHLRSDQSVQQSLNRTYPCLNQHVVAMATCTTTKNEVTAAVTPTAGIVPAALTPGTAALMLAAEQQGTPNMPSRRSLGKAMIASLAPAATVTPKQGPAASMQDLGCGIRNEDCRKESPPVQPQGAGSQPACTGLSADANQPCSQTPTSNVAPVDPSKDFPTNPASKDAQSGQTIDAHHDASTIAPAAKAPQESGTSQQEGPKLCSSKDAPTPFVERRGNQSDSGAFQPPFILFRVDDCHSGFSDMSST